jgi:hypothetical protein
MAEVTAQITTPAEGAAKTADGLADSLQQQ